MLRHSAKLFRSSGTLLTNAQRYSSQGPKFVNSELNERLSKLKEAFAKDYPDKLNEYKAELEKFKKDFGNDPESGLLEYMRKNNQHDVAKVIEKLRANVAADFDGTLVQPVHLLPPELRPLVSKGPFVRLPDDVYPIREPVNIAVTGAAGQIGYSLLFRIASGDLFGPGQPVNLQLIELPGALNALRGVVMELRDCAFPLVNSVIATDDLAVGFKDVEFAFLVGAKPRGKGMERKDLLKDNAAIFTSQGKALNANASRDVRVIVVGNPANTNALIASRNAPSISPRNFSAMTRLDHNRGLAQIAEKTGCAVNEIRRFAIWGNHSATQYPDLSHTTIKGKWAKEIINDDKWIRDNFIPTVQQRGAAIINARGLSSAASAASAAIDHIRTWATVEGTNGDWTSMGVYSDGSYGATKGLYFSYPIVCANGDYTILPDVPVDPFSAERIEASHKELLEEMNAVRDFFPQSTTVNVAKPKN